MIHEFEFLTQIECPEGQLLCLPLSTMFDHYPPPSLPSAPSAPPQEVHLLSLSSTSIRVSWVAPPRGSRHGEIVSYSLAYRALTGEDTERHQVSGISADVTGYVLEDLEKWMQYLVWVRAHTDVGPGPESPAARIRTKEDGTFLVQWEAALGSVELVTFLLLFASVLLLQLHLTDPHQMIF